MMRFERAIESVKAALPSDKEVVSLIKMCGFHPVEGWNTWANHHGNRLKIKRNRITLLKSEYNIPVEDVYYNASYKKIYDVSKWAFVCFFKDFCIVWYVGLDNTIRACYIDQDGGGRISPLHYGIKAIREVIKLAGNDIDDVRFRVPIEGEAVKCWAAKLPLSKRVMDDMTNLNKEIAEKFI